MNATQSVANPYAPAGGLGITMSPFGPVTPETPGGGTSAPKSSPVASYNGPLAGVSWLGEPFIWYLGLILLLFILKFLSEHEKIPLNPEHLHIGGYDFMAVGVTSVLFIASFKLLMAKWPVAGLSNVAAFV